jgi:hypothetical protein
LVWQLRGLGKCAESELLEVKEPKIPSQFSDPNLDDISGTFDLIKWAWHRFSLLVTMAGEFLML